MKSLKYRLQWGAGLAVTLAGLFFYLNWVPAKWKELRRPGQEQIWRYVERESARHGLNPDFVYAIIFAESSFNPDADSGYARGLMQMSEGAWQTVERSSWDDAYDWKRNIRAGTAYLAWIKGELEKDGHFSYPVLAASYRFGLNKVKAAYYNTARLPSTRNLTYQQLFAGKLNPVPRPGGSA